MSDIRFNQWLHQSGTGGVSQVDGGHVGIGTTNPDIAVHSANAKKLNVGIVTANSVYAGNFYGNGSNLSGLAADKIIEGDTKVEVVDSGSQYIVGEVNGSEKIRIDSNGRLLLGTTTEGHPAADDFTIANTANANDMGITLRSADNGQGAIYFSDGTSGADEYRGIINYNHTNNFFSIFTDASEKLRIDSDGKVKIGNSGGTPAGKLHIDEIGNGDIVAELTANSPMFTYRNGSNAWFHAGKHPSADVFVIADGATTTTNERLRILSNGHVAIGHDIANDTGMFKVIAADGQSDDQYVGQFKNLEATTNRNWGLLVQAGSSSTDESFRVRNSANNADHLLVRGNGIISMPKQPMVRTRGGWSNVDWNGYKQMSWNGEDEDIGGNFSGGVFTVPSGGAGRYVLTAQFIGPSSSGFVLWSFFKNTTALNPWVQIYNTNTNVESGAGTVAVTCAVGDTLRIAWHGNYNTPYNGGYNSFSIYKVH